jgi:hypothetical protein
VTISPCPTFFLRYIFWKIRRWKELVRHDLADWEFVHFYMILAVIPSRSWAFRELYAVFRTLSVGEISF